MRPTSGKEKYKRWYDAICERGRMRKRGLGYERHHIIPRSMGGSSAASNFAVLTYREHFLAHWLLTKFTNGASLRKMQHALGLMSRNNPGQIRIVAGWQFELSKRVGDVARREAARSNNPFKGRTHSPETCAKWSAIRKGRPLSAEHRAAMTGRTLSAEHRAKISESGKGRVDSAETRSKRNASLRGRVFSAETRTKMSEARKDFVFSEEHRAKLSAAQKGKTHTDEARAKIRAAKLGTVRGPHSLETRAKMRAAWGLRKAAADFVVTT